MMIDVTVLVAGIAAIAAIAAAVIAWLAQRSTVRLQSELSGSEERLRSTLARDLATHESAVRVQGEIELRLLTQASESIAQSMVVLAQANETLLALSTANELDGPVENIPFDTINKTLLHTGLFLPPQLDGPYLEAAQAFAVGLSEINECRTLKPDVRLARCEEIETRCMRLVFGFRDKAAAWKTSAWQDVRRSRASALPVSESVK